MASTSSLGWDYILFVIFFPCRSFGSDQSVNVLFFMLNFNKITSMALICWYCQTLPRGALQYWEKWIPNTSLEYTLQLLCYKLPLKVSDHTRPRSFQIQIWGPKRWPITTKLGMPAKCKAEAPEPHRAPFLAPLDLRVNSPSYEWPWLQKDMGPRSFQIQIWGPKRWCSPT